MTLDFSIGKNTSEGKTHMMCIAGAEGEISAFLLVTEFYPYVPCHKAGDFRPNESDA